MRNLLDRVDGTDLVESGEWGQPWKEYSIEIFDPDNEESLAHIIPCKDKEEAQDIFKRIYRKY